MSMTDTDENDTTAVSWNYETAVSGWTYDTTVSGEGYLTIENNILQTGKCYLTIDNLVENNVRMYNISVSGECYLTPENNVMKNGIWLGGRILNTTRSGYLTLKWVYTSRVDTDEKNKDNVEELEKYKRENLEYNQNQIYIS